MTSQEFHFEAQTDRLLELLTHSIYSNKEIFLRELLSNAADALDKARFKSLTDPQYLGDSHELAIHLSIDSEKKTITIEDNGIGMTPEELKTHLGTIAKSGTKDFIEKLKETQKEHSLIGQFGVGFYSVFMVASKVEVTSKSQDSETAAMWVSQGKGSFEIHPSEKISRGTVLTITLKEDAQEYTQRRQITDLIKKHSNFLPYPVKMQKTDSQEWEQINETKAIWNRSKSEITQQDYETFYNEISRDFEKPLTYIHGDAEGMISYKSLLYIPQKKNPFKNTDDPSQDYGPRLYVQNVLILEQSKALLPAWLRFVQGIIATNDLPLNISREMLQSHPNLEKIQTGITKKILDKLASVRQENPESYKIFLQDFSRYLKEGIYYDTLHRETLASLLLFETVRHPEGISLDAYQESRKISGHSNVIRYVLAKNRNEALAHPYLEAIQAAGEDVVLLTDPIDEWIISVLHQYKESPLESIAAQQKDAAPSEVTESDKDFFAKIQGFLTDKLSAVVYSDRLGSHFAALAANTSGLTPQMERMMKSMGQEVPQQSRVLELNPNHTLTKKLQAWQSNEEYQKAFENLTKYAYNQALFLEGGEISDPKQFIASIEQLLQ